MSQLELNETEQPNIFNVVKLQLFYMSLFLEIHTPNFEAKPIKPKTQYPIKVHCHISIRWLFKNRTLYYYLNFKKSVHPNIYHHQ